MSTKWSPDSAQLEAARRALAEADDIGALLEAAGKVVALGGEDDGAMARARTAPSADAIRGAVLAIDFASLEDAAVRAREALAAMDEGDAAQARVVEALDVRDAIELRLLGAERILGRAIDLDADRESYLVEFANLLRPHAWRMTAINDARDRRTAQIAPALRERFWWWSLGAGVDARANEALAAVASLVARFPEAKERFEDLTRVERALAAAAKEEAAAKSNVVSLAAWLSRAQGKSAANELRVAAAPATPEVTVVRTRDYEISWREPNALIVDLLANRAEGRVPAAHLAGGGVVPFEAQPSAIERFVLELPASAMKSPWLVIRLPLATGEIDVRLPPSSSS